MNPAHVFIPAMWLAWIAYWYVASLRVKQTQRTESARSPLSDQLSRAGQCARQTLERSK
jgi:hypothetical protein